LKRRMENKSNILRAVVSPLGERNSPVPPTKTPPPGFGRLNLSDDENTENVKPKVNIQVGPGGDNASELSGLGSGGGQPENQKPYKKKTRGTRGGRKNRLRKMKESEKLLKESLVTTQVQTKQYLRPENGKDLAYSFEKLIELRERNLSKILPVGIEKIDRKSNATRPIEIFPVYFLPEESTNKTRETSTGNEATKLSDRIDEICKRIVQNQLDEKLKVHGIEPYFSTRTKNKTPDLLDTSSISASSLVTTPREYFTPRSVHSSASVSKASVTSVTPNSPRDATLSSPLDVISEDEAATQSVATDGSAENSDSRKFKMRPPKMSSFTADAPKAAEFQPMYHGATEGQGNMIYGGLIPYALPYPVSDYGWPYPVAYPVVYPYIPNYFSPTVSSSQSPASSRRSSRLSSY